MASFADIIKQKSKEWDCPELMDRATAPRGNKLPFSSPLMNWCTYGGIPRNKITEFHGAPSGGKAQPMDSKILTPSGFVLMRDIKIGDTVYDRFGKPCVVDGIYPQGVHKIYKITLQDGTSVSVAENHLNSVWQWDKDKHQQIDYVIDTDELIEKVNSYKPYGSRSKYRVYMASVDFPKQSVPIDPYLLGALIGDGGLSDRYPKFANAESDVVSKVDAILHRDWDCFLSPTPALRDCEFAISNLEKWYPVTIEYGGKEFSPISAFKDYLESQGYPRLDCATIYKISDGKQARILKQYPELSAIKVKHNESSGLRKLRDAIRALGLDCKSIHKHIPKQYLLNDYNTRLELLRGLFDTDGYSKWEQKSQHISVNFSTSSPQLSEDFAFLVRSLGIRDTVTLKKGKYRDAEGNQHIVNDSYIHFLHVPNDIRIFSSEKHTSNYHPKRHETHRNIESVEYTGDAECQCLHVTSDDHTYITDDFIPTHNTTTAIDICKNAYKIFKEEYETQLQDLRTKAAKDKKKYQGALEDLEDRGIKKVLYLDLENSFDGAWAKTLGIKPDEINIMTPPNLAAEEILETMQELICTGEVGLVVLDSIPSLVTKRELDKHYGESTVAALAGLLCVFFRKVVPLLTRYECTLLFINQIRDNMDNPYVIKVPGGKAPQFYSSLRILFQLGNPVDFLGNELPKSAESPAGYIINAKIVKQKSAPNNRRVGTYFLMYDSGIREDFDFAKLAVGKGIIRKRGGWFTICDPYTGEVLTTDTGAELKINGMAKVYAFLQGNTEYYEKLKKYISDDINGVENSEEDDCTEVKEATEVFGEYYTNTNEDE